MTVASVDIDPRLISDVESAVMARQGRAISATERRFQCPAHDDHNPSARFNTDKGVWRCDACSAGGGTIDLAKRLDVPLTRTVGSASTETIRMGREVAHYDYTDEVGAVLFQVVRYDPKGFAQRAPDRGGWRPGIDGVRRVIYRLPEVLAVVAAANPEWRVYIVEGEKDADALSAVGLCTTTSPMGAGKWRDEYADALRGGHVVIVPDNDDVGRKHAERVARSCFGKAATVRIVELPGKGKDASDWLAAGGTRAELERLAAATPEWAGQPELTAAHDGLSIAATEFVNLNIPPVEWLIDGVWQAQAVGFVAGPPKAFKSFMVLDLAFAVASGQNFLGRFPPGERKARPVMLVQLESAKSAFRDRVRATADRFLGVPPSLRLITNVPILLEDPSWVERVEAELERHRPELLILDPLASLTRGDENSAQEMGEVVRLVRGWRDRYGCAVAIVHHSGKTSEKGSAKRSGEKMRGSSAFHGAVESALYVERVDDESPRITVRVEQKEAEPPRPFVCEFQSDTSQLVITGDVFSVTDEMIRESVANRGRATVADVVKDLPRGTATAQYVRDRLKAMAGVVSEVQGGNKPTVYRVEPESTSLRF